MSMFTPRRGASSSIAFGPPKRSLLDNNPLRFCCTRDDGGVGRAAFGVAVEELALDTASSSCDLTGAEAEGPLSHNLSSVAPSS